MSFVQLVLKQMRQRALSTWLTLLSVLLGVGLAIAVIILHRESHKLFGQTDYGYDIILGPKGSELSLVLSTVYHSEPSQGNVPYALYESLQSRAGLGAYAKIAVPYAYGDVYQGHRIVGTTPRLFGVGEDGKPLATDRVLEYRPGKRYELAQGGVFHSRKFQAVVGDEVARRTGLRAGSTFKAVHEGGREEEHEEQWTVTGVLRPTQTAADRLIFISLPSFYAVAEHAQGLQIQTAIREGRPPTEMARPKPRPNDDAHDDHDHPVATTRATTQACTHPDHDHAHHDHPPATTRASTQACTHPEHDHAHHDQAPAAAGAAPPAHDHHGHEHHAYTLLPDGTIDLHLPKSDWQLSAILVKSRSAIAASQLPYIFRSRTEAMAVSPALVMAKFFNDYLARASMVLLVISVLVSVVAAVSILVSIYNSVAARWKEIATLRALGATRRKVLCLICFEAGLIGLLGGLAGLVAGHGIAFIGSTVAQRMIGQGIEWLAVSATEGLYLAGMVVLAVFAGLAPALKAYRVPVADGLVSG